MYASGDSADAVKFNCIQRGHQQVRIRSFRRAGEDTERNAWRGEYVRHALSPRQALETLPIFYVLSFVGGLKNPFLVSLSGAEKHVPKCAENVWP